MPYKNSPSLKPCQVARRLLLMAGNDIFGHRCVSRAPYLRKAKVKDGAVVLRFSGDVTLGDDKGWVVGTTEGGYAAVTAVEATGKTVTLRAYILP